MVWCVYSVFLFCHLICKSKSDHEFSTHSHNNAKYVWGFILNLPHVPLSFYSLQFITIAFLWHQNIIKLFRHRRQRIILRRNSNSAIKNGIILCSTKKILFAIFGLKYWLNLTQTCTQRSKEYSNIFNDIRIKAKSKNEKINERETCRINCVSFENYLFSNSWISTRERDSLFNVELILLFLFLLFVCLHSFFSCAQHHL